MNDSYTEVLVKKEHRAIDSLIKYALYALTVIFILGGLFFGMIIWIGAVILLAACYFIIPKTDLEYEYLYVNGEMDIDMIMSKIKRKKAYSFKMNDVEIMASTKSHRLDYYHNNPKIKVKDYSSGNDANKRFSLIVRDKETISEVIIESDEYLCELMKKYAPSKVFLND